MPQSRSTALPRHQKKERLGTNTTKHTLQMKPQQHKQRRTETEEPPWTVSMKTTEWRLVSNILSTVFVLLLIVIRLWFLLSSCAARCGAFFMFVVSVSFGSCLILWLFNWKERTVLLCISLVFAYILSIIVSLLFLLLLLVCFCYCGTSWKSSFLYLIWSNSNDFPWTKTKQLVLTMRSAIIGHYKSFELTTNCNYLPDRK